MWKITKKPGTANSIWDAENSRVLCDFANGELETDDVELARALAALGHTVDGDLPPIEPPEGADEGADEGAAEVVEDTDEAADIDEGAKKGGKKSGKKK